MHPIDFEVNDISDTARYTSYHDLHLEIYIERRPRTIRVITKLPNTEQSSKGKVKTHKSKNRQNQSTTGNWETAMALTWYRHF